MASRGKGKKKKAAIPKRDPKTGRFVSKRTSKVRPGRDPKTGRFTKSKPKSERKRKLKPMARVLVSTEESIRRDQIRDLVVEAANAHGGVAVASSDSARNVWAECTIKARHEEVYDLLLDLENDAAWTSFDGWIQIAFLIRFTRDDLEAAEAGKSPLFESNGLFEIRGHWYRSRNAHYAFLGARDGILEAIHQYYPDSRIKQIKVRLNWNPANRQPGE